MFFWKPGELLQKTSWKKWQESLHKRVHAGCVEELRKSYQILTLKFVAIVQTLLRLRFYLICGLSKSLHFHFPCKYKGRDSRLLSCAGWHGFHGVHIIQIWQASNRNTFSLSGKQQQHLSHRIHRACPQVSNTCKYPKRFVCTGLTLSHCFACVHGCFGHFRCPLKTCMCVTIRRWLWQMNWAQLCYTITHYILFLFSSLFVCCIETPARSTI